MALMGEEALAEIWNLIKGKTLEMMQRYKWEFVNSEMSVSVFRQMNICIVRISSNTTLTNFKVTLPNGFYPEKIIDNENGISIQTDGNMIVNISEMNSVSVTYSTSNLLPNEDYKM